MTDKSSTPPARLFVLLARNAPVGVILRRGTSDWVQMIHWDTKHDVFTPGQWFHGRIYEHRCDISPNGRYFVYCAYKPGNKQTNPSYGDRWTAISRPPYFSALALWPLKNWIGGGGFFVERKKLLLNHLPDNIIPHPNHPLEELDVVETDEWSFMRNSVFYHRIRRDGWRPVSERIRTQTRLPFWYKGAFVSLRDPRIRFEKAGIICQVLYRFRVVKDRGIRRHSLYEIVPEYRYCMRVYQQPDIKLRDVNWADYDSQKHRLVLTKYGKLFTAAVTDQGKLSLTELADFNDNPHEPVATPDWAKKW